MKKLILISIAFMLLSLTNKAQTIEKTDSIPQRKEKVGFKIGTEFSFYSLGKISATYPSEDAMGNSTDKEFGSQEMTSCYGYSLFAEYYVEAEKLIFCSFGIAGKYLTPRESSKLVNKFSGYTIDGYMTLGYPANRFFKPFFLLGGGVSVVQFPENAIFHFDNSTFAISDVEIDGTSVAGHMLVGLGTSMEISSKISANFNITYDLDFPRKTINSLNDESIKLDLSSMGVSLGISYNFFK